MQEVDGRYLLAHLGLGLAVTFASANGVPFVSRVGDAMHP